ncbi:hypothetical protein Pcinc_039912 [Petrolisthes cinctipes]|uniref:Uncharacterized protein n=1 Tax=Petrolisthes cinctipes TaxID=88211 RepID=A0AAE1BMX6_PETCI|nr:hypothetical protein Pcinc_039912 [Petrolisthes cinctipes]
MSLPTWRGYYVNPGRHRCPIDQYTEPSLSGCLPIIISAKGRLPYPNDHPPSSLALQGTRGQIGRERRRKGEKEGGRERKRKGEERGRKERRKGEKERREEERERRREGGKERKRKGGKGGEYVDSSSLALLPPTHSPHSQSGQGRTRGFRLYESCSLMRSPVMVVFKDSIMVFKDSIVVFKDSIIVFKDSIMVFKDITIVFKDITIVFKDITIVFKDNTKDHRILRTTLYSIQGQHHRIQG